MDIFFCDGDDLIQMGRKYGEIRSLLGCLPGFFGTCLFCDIFRVEGFRNALEAFEISQVSPDRKLQGGRQLIIFFGSRELF